MENADTQSYKYIKQMTIVQNKIHVIHYIYNV